MLLRPSHILTCTHQHPLQSSPFDFLLPTSITSAVQCEVSEAMPTVAGASEATCLYTCIYLIYKGDVVCVCVCVCSLCTATMTNRWKPNFTW